MFDWWRNLSVRFKGLIVVLVPITALLFSVFALYLNHKAEEQAHEAFAHTLSVTEQARKVFTLLVDAESGVRGYLASEDERFLGPYERAKEQLPKSLRSLDGMVVDPIAQKSIEPLLPLVQQKLDTLGSLRGIGSANSGPTVHRLREGKRQMDQIRGVFARLLDREDTLAAQRSELEDDASRRTTIALAVSTGTGILGALLAMMIFTLGVTRRLERVRDNADRLAMGERLGRPDMSRDEIGSLDQDLHTGGELLFKRQADLVQARDEARSANQAKSDFLSRMSHELRTPLNAILGFGQLLETKDLDQTNKDHLAQIMKAGRHLLALINDVLDIARIESGHLTLSLEPVQVSQVVQEVVDLVHPMALERDVRFDADLERLSYSVVADRQRLKQALLNLVSNAIKYNRPGGLIAIRCEPAGTRLRLHVVDTGYGISLAQIDRLFNEFDRLGADSTGSQGTGLGLALTKSLIEAMNGSIAVASEVGSGSTFTMELPVAEPRHPEFASTPIRKVASETNGPLREVRVLYIEDNLENLRLVEAILSHRRGTELMSAMQGRLGLEMARLHSPDVILLDLHLPDMDGESVLRHLKGDPATRAIPVVMLTADSFPKTRTRLQDSGIHAFLSKPLEVAEFLQIFDEATKGNGHGG